MRKPLQFSSYKEENPDSLQENFEEKEGEEKWEREEEEGDTACLAARLKLGPLYEDQGPRQIPPSLT